MERNREESGAAAVEFALVLPMLLMLVFGIINVGIAFGQTLALNSAAREAARQAAVPGQTCAEVGALGTAAARSLAMQPAEVTPSVTPCPAGDVCTGSAPGSAVKVTLSYTGTWAVPFLIPGIPATYSLAGHGEFRCEYS